MKLYLHNICRKLKADESEFLTRVLESKTKRSIDDTPHQVGERMLSQYLTFFSSQLFVEMDELQGDAWVEIARFVIKSISLPHQVPRKLFYFITEEMLFYVIASLKTVF